MTERERTRHAGTRGRASRAQTTLDFAIGMGIFLLAVMFVFMFIPSLTAPFVDGSQENTVTADRVASHLSEGALGDPNRPYVLDVECTSYFFNETAPAPSRCGYNHTTADYKLRAGVSQRIGLNVTLERDGTIQCYDGDGGVVDIGGTCTTEFRIGPDPTTDSSVVVARRVVSIAERDVTLFVRVW